MTIFDYFLPFHNLSSQELLSELTFERLPFLSYSNKYFNPIEDADRFDFEYDPNCIAAFGSRLGSLQCHYYSLDEFHDLMKLNSLSGVAFTSLFLNMRSIPKNFDEFLIDFTPDSTPYDVICCCETRLTQSIEPL